MSEERKDGIPDIPTQVFDKFVAELATAGVSAGVVARLRKTLLQDQNLSETAIRAALFSTDQVT